jgi:hypothetical protein
VGRERYLGGLVEVMHGKGADVDAAGLPKDGGDGVVHDLRGLDHADDVEGLQRAGEADLRGDVALAAKVVIHDGGVLDTAAEVVVAGNEAHGLAVHGGGDACQ